MIPDALIFRECTTALHLRYTTSEGGERGISQRRSLVTKEGEALPPPGLDGVPGHKYFEWQIDLPQKRSLIGSKPASIYIKMVSLVLVDNVSRILDQTLREAL
jgi:hypothetical protein